MRRFLQWLGLRRPTMTSAPLAIAPSGRGKGVGPVIPLLTVWDGPVRVFDPKDRTRTLH